MDRNLFFVFAMIFTLSFISLVGAATYEGSLNFDNQGGIINVVGDACQEDWSSSYWTDCVNNTQTFVCFQSNPTCDTENLKPANCGEARACNVDPPPQENGGGGGGSGGGSGGSSGVIFLASNEQEECVESWECGGWSNFEQECGTRSCTDLNACGTAELKPLTFKVCSSGASSNGITGFVTAVGNLAKSPIAIVIFIVLVIGIVAFANIIKGK